MGSEGEIGELNSTVYVAVGKNVKEGKMLLNWAVKNSEGMNISLALLHVHQPTSLVSLFNAKPSGSKLKNHLSKACLELERLKMQRLMNQYLVFLTQMGADTISMDMSNIEEGILQLVVQHRVRWLVMGAAQETFCTKKLLIANSSKAMVINNKAPPSCHISFICNGILIHTRDSDPHLTTARGLSSSKTKFGTILACDSKETTDVNTDNVQCVNLTQSVEEVIGTMNTAALNVIQTSGDISSLLLKVDHSDDLPCSSFDTSSESQEEQTSDLSEKLENETIDAENSKQRAFEGSLRRWRAEEDASEAVHKAEVSESLYQEERRRNNKIEQLLISQRQEIELMKTQKSECLEKIQLIKDQKPTLETQLREACCSEKELEGKIIQAVNLLITFKETRDRLQIEYDSVIRKLNKYRILQTENSLGASDVHLFGVSFSDIIEATENFNPSQRIGEGRYGTVFKGILCHVKVAIKMLPSRGSQSDAEFRHEVEVLSRVRHPNLVVLIGACPESRALIYEFIENGSLETYLSTPGKARSLPWQTRIRIAIELCSALLFLHGNSNTIYSVHGNLKPSNILLDVNFVTKISGFGIPELVSQTDDNTFIPHACNPETAAYMEPKAPAYDELTPESDVYSFGIILLRMFTRRPAVGVVKDVRCALQGGRLDDILDTSAGDWPLRHVQQLANLALECCERDRVDRPNLALEVWQVLEPMREVCDLSQFTPDLSSTDSKSPRKIPSHFVCPIYQEVMTDPHIAPDGFTYEGDAIKGWFDSGHETSPMTNLKLDNCDLLPNYALYYAIQEWQRSA